MDQECACCKCTAISFQEFKECACGKYTSLPVSRCCWLALGVIPVSVSQDSTTSWHFGTHKTSCRENVRFCKVKRLMCLNGVIEGLRSSCAVTLARVRQVVIVSHRWVWPRIPDVDTRDWRVAGSRSCFYDWAHENPVRVQRAGAEVCGRGLRQRPAAVKRYQVFQGDRLNSTGAHCVSSNPTGHTICSSREYFIHALVVSVLVFNLKCTLSTRLY